MKYIDRMGNVTVEENGQDKLLRHLYNDRGGRLCLRVLVSPWISKMAGRLLNTGFPARYSLPLPSHLQEQHTFSVILHHVYCKT